MNYGGGYAGIGYDRGRWSNNVLRYNTFVTRVDGANVRNVYLDRNVYVNNSTTRIRYNGGRNGLPAHPNAQQLTVASARSGYLNLKDAQRRAPADGCH